MTYPLRNSSLLPGAPVDQTMAAPGNVPGAEYPRWTTIAERLFRIYAPEAQTVSVQIGDTYEMTKGQDGYWMVTTLALAPGLQLDNLVSDGAAVPVPGSRTVLGSSGMLSGLEVPDESEDFAREKQVPHGAIRAHYYHSGLSDSTREAIVYTPPSYDARPSARYPVLYLLPGMGENQLAWTEQGRADAILDNLIAEGRAKEMIVVMEEAGTSGALAKRGARGRGRAGYGGNFSQILTSETVPMIDAAYRTIPDRDHRAIAGARSAERRCSRLRRTRLSDLLTWGPLVRHLDIQRCQKGTTGSWRILTNLSGRSNFYSLVPGPLRI